MPTNKTYEIGSWEQLLNAVNPENVGRMAVDLCKTLILYANTSDHVRKSQGLPESTPNTTVLPMTHFEWVDDGINEITQVKITDPITGEVGIINLKEN